MTQFTPPLPPLRHQITPFPDSTTMNPKNQQLPRTKPVLNFPTSKALIGTTTFGDANCMEQLLVHCANAIEANDVTLAQQLLWVLNNIAPPDGDSNQRLAFSFLRALTVRAAKNGTCAKMLATVEDSRSALEIHKFSVLELANFVDLTPWHRFDFTAASTTILEAFEGFSVVHILDLNLTHCMQIPTLIDAIAGRHMVPALIKLAVAACRDRVGGCRCCSGFGGGRWGRRSCGSYGVELGCQRAGLAVVEPAGRKKEQEKTKKKKKMKTMVH